MATDIVKPRIPTEEIHAAIKNDRLRHCPSGEEGIKEYREYVGGKAGYALTEQMQEILEGLLTHKACENIGRKVITEARDRLRLLRLTCEDKETEKWLDDWYKTERIQARQSKIHFDTLRDGNHGVAVNWDKKKSRVRMYRELWWDGLEGLYIGYDRAEEPVYAVKDWFPSIADLSKVRRVIWFDDRFERWASSDGGNSWQTFTLLGEESWTGAWLDENDAPMGIPYIHFKNTGQGEDVYGNSELAGGVLGLIDQVQDTHYTLCGSARMNGFQVIWGTGVELKPLPGSPGNFEPVKAGPGAFLHSKDPQSRFGRIEPADPEGIIKTRTVKLQAISTTTQTPYHLISGGDWPSGEALMRAEQPAIGKATSQRDSLTNYWSMVAHLATKINNKWGKGPKLNTDIETAMIQAPFDGVDRRDPLTKSVIVNNLGDQISNQEALRIMGYTATEIENIMEEKKAAAKDAADNAALMFGRGVGSGTNLPGRGDPNADDPTIDDPTVPPAASGNADKSKGN